MQPNRDLLNSKFEGYKLADTPLSFIQQSFNGGVHMINITNHFSYERIHQATMYNHLVLDPWDRARVYWSSGQKQNIMCATLLVSKRNNAIYYLMN